MADPRREAVRPTRRESAALIAPRAAAYGLAMFLALGLVRIARDVGLVPGAVSASLAFLGIAAFPIVVAWLWHRSEELPAPEVPRSLGSSMALMSAAALFVLAGAVIAIRGDSVSVADPAADVEVAPPLAVLPFLDLDGRTDSYFASGLRAELVASLASVDGMVVTARSSARAFTDVNRDAVEAGRELGARSVLDISVRRTPGRLRLDARLFDVPSGQVAWRAHVDTTSEEIAAVRDSLVRSVAARFGHESGPPLDRSLERRSATRDVFDLYFQGVHRSYSSAVNELLAAADYLVLAVEDDPSFGPAWSALAGTYATLPRVTDFPAARAREDGAAAARTALQIEPEDAAAHTALGEILHAYEYDASGARDHLQRAVELDPGAAEPHELLCELELSRGDVAAAAEHCAAARRLDPLRFRGAWLEADLARVGGDLPGSVQRLDSLARVHPDFAPLAADLAIARLVAGDTTEAAAIDLTLWLTMLGAPDSIGYRLLNRSGDVGARPGELLRGVEGLADEPAAHAALLVQLGDANGAMQAARITLEERHPAAVRFRAWPEYAGLRERLAFRQLLADAGLGTQEID